MSEAIQMLYFHLSGTGGIRFGRYVGPACLPSPNLDYAGSPHAHLPLYVDNICCTLHHFKIGIYSHANLIVTWDFVSSNWCPQPDTFLKNLPR